MGNAEATVELFTAYSIRACILDNLRMRVLGCWALMLRPHNPAVINRLGLGQTILRFDRQNRTTTYLKHSGSTSM